MKKIWNKEKVISEILSRYQKGRPLNGGYVQRKDVPLNHAAYSYFGNWRNALKAAGVDYADIQVEMVPRKVVWNKNIVVATIKERYRLGQKLNSNYLELRNSQHTKEEVHAKNTIVSLCLGEVTNFT